MKYVKTYEMKDFFGGDDPINYIVTQDEEYVVGRISSQWSTTWYLYPKEFLDKNYNNRNKFSAGTTQKQIEQRLNVVNVNARNGKIAFIDKKTKDSGYRDFKSIKYLDGFARMEEDDPNVGLEFEHLKTYENFTKTKKEMIH